MKRPLFRSLVLRSIALVSCLAVFGCSTFTSQTQVKRPFFYTASKKDQTIYLLGTMHIGVLKDDLPPQVLNHFKGSNAFAFEIELTNKIDYNTEVANYARSMPASRKPDAPSLTQLLSASEHKSLVLRLSETGTYPDAKIQSRIDEMTPMNAVDALVQKELLNSPRVEVSRSEFVRLQTKFSMDGELIKAAKKMNRPQIYLDGTVNEFTKNFLDFYFSNQLALLKNYLKKPPQTYQSNYHDLVQVRTQYLLGESFDLSGETNIEKIVLGYLIEERNQKWVPQIVSLAKQHKVVFVAVGAGHFGPSKSSLLNLLRKEGYVIESFEDKYSRL